MEIIYYQNPLRTRIYLNDAEKERLKLNIKIEELQERLYSVYYQLVHHNPLEVLECPNPHRNGKTHLQLAQEEFEEDWFKTIDKEVEHRYKLYIDDLENGYHMGDCTCIPCSCMKCHAESLVGIDTIAGLGKHSASKIDGLFTKVRSPFDIRTIDEVLELLKDYEPNPIKPESWKNSSQEYYESHIPRWRAEGKAAYDWLLKYKKEKLGR